MTFNVAPFQHVSSLNICPARASPVNCECCYCYSEQRLCHEAHRTEPASAEVRKIVCRLQHSQPSSKLPLEATFNTITVCRELHEMGFHGQAAAHKSKITKHNAKRRRERRKACPPPLDSGVVETCSLE